MKAVSLYRLNPVGERNGRALLTWEIVRLIRSDRDSLKLSLSVLAKKYDTSIRTVSRIINNKNWKEENI